jgi:hypothetical protein
MAALIAMPMLLLCVVCLAGSQLESGDLKGASATLSSGWVEEFKRATQVSISGCAT